LLIKKKEIRPLSIVAVTADVTDNNKLWSEKYGFDAFLAKPVMHSALDRVLEEVPNLVKG